MTFDTPSYAKKLKAAGFTEAQAEVLAEAQAGLIHEQFATKEDLKALETALRIDLDGVRRDLREQEERLNYRMNELEQRLGHRIEAMESKLTLRLGSLIAIAVGVVAALVKLL